MTMDVLDILLRLGSATLIGAAIGLNRDLCGKPTGVRTLGIVCLGSALIVMASYGFQALEAHHWDPISRTIQGLITGIGFLGAGVILRDGQSQEVQGLTTAACIWLTACLGVVCGIAAWPALVVAVPLVFLLLTLGGPLERYVQRRWSGQGERPEDKGS
jgi:putative Mg2+ transporter-C (MgtC) family protein